jgi:hypothetical protein
MRFEQESEQKLDRLLTEYKNACPEVDAGASFMPGVWRRIEAKRQFTFALQRWARGFVTAAAAACVLAGMVLVSPLSQHSLFYATTYLDVLDADHDRYAYADLHPAAPQDDHSVDRSLEE